MNPSFRLLQVPGALPQHFLAKISLTNSFSHLLLSSRKKIHFLVLAVYILGNYACVKEVPIADRHRRERHEETDVFVAGQFQSVLTMTGYAAAYWKNGNYVPLTDGITQDNALAIAATRHDVFVAGYIDHQAAVWKNGHLTLLTNGKASSMATSIFLFDHDIYVGGEEGGIAKYWKNGQAVTLGEGVVNSIAVERDNVYAAGENANNEGGYWKNGHWVPIFDASGPTQVQSIALAGKDVYVAGAVAFGIGTYWKNGVAVRLNDGPFFQGSFVQSIAVSGNNIEACGWGETADYPEGRYWHNGDGTFLPGNLRGSQGNSIVISGSDVYIAGFTDDFTFSDAFLWKNGVATELLGPPALITQNRANCVFVLKTEERDRHEEGHFDEIGKY